MLIEFSIALMVAWVVGLVLLAWQVYSDWRRPR